MKKKDAPTHIDTTNNASDMSGKTHRELVLEYLNMNVEESTPTITKAQRQRIVQKFERQLDVLVTELELKDFNWFDTNDLGRNVYTAMCELSLRDKEFYDTVREANKRFHILTK